jgi:cell division protein FtsW
MIAVSRTDTSVVGRWWWTVDRWMLAAVAVLLAIGAVLTLAASPATAQRIGLPPYHFVVRQAIFLAPALAAMWAVSLLPPRHVRRLAIVAMLAALAMMFATTLVGEEIKGARRWLYVAGLSLQPSEFFKPAFAVVTGWMLAEWRREENPVPALIGAALLAVAVVLLVRQPDIGMLVVVVAVWAAQLFVAGLPMALVGALAGLGVGGLAAAYALVPHVTSRIDRFLDPSGRDNYQIERSLEAFAAGGLFGRGPGEGSVKSSLPDAHTDFIFAVAGEEFGLWLCLAIIAVFAFIVVRGLARLLQENDLFVLYAAAGLFVQFGLQAAINIGVNLRLLPTKGMTLPFLSYGGSSLLALAFGMGMLLALCRARPEAEARR